MTQSLHPEQALFDSHDSLPIIPSCDHFAGNEKLAKRSFELQHEFGPIFNITLDLEDGAVAGQETQLLETFLNLLRSPENRYRMTGIRVHDYHSPFWKEEIDQIACRVGDIVSHITIPKTQSKEELALMIEHLQRRCEKIGLKRQIPIHVLIESQRALSQVWEIAALPWLRSLDFGIMDFVSAHGGAIPSTAMVSPGQFEHQLVKRAKVEIAAAALAHNLIPTHNVTTAYDNTELVKADAFRAKNEFGFLRMWSIHPKQIPMILEAMRPSFEDVARGCRILVEAHARAWAPVSVDGLLHDRASFRYFWNLLKRAKMHKVPLSPEASRLFFTE